MAAQPEKIRRGLGHDIRRHLVVASSILASMGGASSIAASTARGEKLPSSTPVQDINLINHAGLSQFSINAFEQAEVWQSKQLRKDWGTPIVRFSTDGWPLYLVKANDHHRYMRAMIGYHTVNRQQKPYARVAVGLHQPPWTVVGSHEVGEELADPNLNRIIDGFYAEPFDPVRTLREFIRYKIGDITGIETMSDFVTKRYYHKGDRGPYDEANRLKHPGSVEYGYKISATGQHFGLPSVPPRGGNDGYNTG